MKLNRWFVIGVLAFLLIIFVIHYQMPQEFVWKPTFSNTDRQPFGCYVFDSIMAENMPHGYTVSDKSLPVLAKDTTPRGILIVASDVEMRDAEMKSLYKLLNSGSHVLIATEHCTSLEDTLLLETAYTFRYKKIRNVIKQKEERDTLRWLADTLGMKPHDYLLFSPLCEWYLRDCILTDSVSEDSVCFHPAHDTITSMASFNDRPIAYTQQVGRGRLTLVTAPLLFTNYTVLDKGNAALVFRFMSLLKDLPVVRTTVFCPDALEASQQTPLRYFLSQPPLRWAVYLTLLLAVLALIFGARRRQRVIPIEAPPENHTIEFVELIGTLYYHSRERRSLVLRKYTYFAEELRRTLHVDITDDEDDGTELLTIATQSGIPQEEVEQLVAELRQLAAADEETEISLKDMKRLIDEMNRIIKNI
ncbi:MAG: DUF4350 domain-containing protein [Prevotella sp.]|nr:DUF4350 domain-containing protein [Prevotella sp.]